MYGQEPGGKRLPAEMRCFDTARIYVKGGDGGRGCVAAARCVPALYAAPRRCRPLLQTPRAQAAQC